MHPRTTATLDKLESIDWFLAVGINNTEQAIVLKTWQEAIKIASSTRSANISLEAVNQYREKLAKVSKENLKLWNPLVRELKPFVLSVVAKKIVKVVKENSLPVAFEQKIQWDILNLCMESELADLVKPGFFTGRSYWYASGHFPCGWEGLFPGGKPIVF